MEEKEKSIFEKILSNDKPRTNLETLKVIPQSEWEHKYVLFSGDESVDKLDSIESFLSKEQVLAFIKDDFLILITEERYGLTIIPLYQLFKRTGDKAIKELMEWFLSRILVSLRLTRSKEGFERQLQAMIMPKKEKGFEIPFVKKKEKPEEEVIYE